MQNHAESLFTKQTPLNINLGSDRFSMFNKERDIPAAPGSISYRFHTRMT